MKVHFHVHKKWMFNGFFIGFLFQPPLACEKSQSLMIL